MLNVMLIPEFSRMTSARRSSVVAHRKVLATSSDRDGKEYVAAFEGIGERSYVSGTQWHPEKNLFEWAPQLDVPRGSAASAATQYMVREGTS